MFSMDPEPDRFLATHALALRNLILVMWECQIDAAGMDIELLAQVFRCHRRALDMPAGEANAPGTLPVHLPILLTAFPQREILRRAFVLGNLQLYTPACARA